MSGYVQRLCGLLALLTVQTTSADILLLVHGYASSAQSWEFSGINNELQARGWVRAGIMAPAYSGLMPTSVAPARRNRSYSANLPAQAPLLLQADYLRRMLGALRVRYPNEKLTLAGHSAGGVVARLALLGGNPYKVDALITIAAPHLGTIRAAQALDVVDARPFFCPGPGIDFLRTAVGGSDYQYLKDSRGILIDLLPGVRGNALHWLNGQMHPDIDYYAVIRQTPHAAGDELVSAYSQNLNNVPGLTGRVRVIYTPGGHSLHAQDGVLLAGILAEAD